MPAVLSGVSLRAPLGMHREEWPVYQAQDDRRLGSNAYAE